MKRILPALFLLFLAHNAFALEVAGVRLDPEVTVNNKTLKLNGYGIRKKFFIKVYIGSLYTSRRFSSAADALNDQGDKLIRMNFLHSRVEKGKITEAFNEGFVNNSPEIAGSGETKRFLALFSGDFSRGDLVDLELAGDGTVTTRHNGKVLGAVVSGKLARAVLAIYLGEKPADEALKKGMLGNAE
jgi:hypothetical protein